MKHKFSSMGRVAIALVLALSFSLVMAVPVSANVSSATVTVDPTLVGTEAQYTIGFETGADGGLTANVGTITVTFLTDTTVPGTTPLYADGAITVNSINVPGTQVSVTGLAVTITTPVSISALEAVDVIFKTTAGIKNPTTATTYTLEVATSAEANKVQSATYAITGLPTVTFVQPDRGNAGETMWVEVTGTGFTGTTTLSSTSFKFGDGVSVSVVAGSYHYLSPTEVDCEIAISSDATAGARGVTATSTAGPGAATADAFTVGLAGTPQVDVWDTYTPVVDHATGGTWSGTTLAMTLDNVHDTIEAVFDEAAATDSDVIRVHEATYNPEGRYPITVDVANVNLVAFGSPVIVPVRAGGNAFDNGVISIQATGVTIDGFDIQNAATSIQGDCGIRALGTGGSFTIKNNTVSGFGDAVTNLPSNTRAINAMTASGTIEDNTVEDSRLGIELSVSANTIIQGNLVQNNYWGIGLFGASTNIKVIKNRVLSNFGGIDVNIGVTGTFELNDIVGNTTGFNNCTAGSIDAMYNYWGSIGGPSAGTGNSTALGNGDAVSDADVVYNPWLSVSYVTVVADGKGYFGSDTLELQKGWNTLSVPLTLYDGANTIAKIEGMGDFLTADNYWGLIYNYDSVEGWVEPTTVLTPCRGYYIKMKAVSNFPVLYSNSVGLPALPLAAGWNLIGSAFGIDKTTWAVEVAVMDPGLALDSIGGQVSVVVNPSAPGQIGDPWSEIWVTGDNSANDMSTGEGYWVFMTDTGTLCGFEITPFYFDFTASPWQ